MLDQSSQPRTTKRVLWKWSLAVTAAVLIFLFWQCGHGLVQGKKLDREAVERFHQELNAGQYEQIYKEASDGFSHSGPESELVKFLQAIHTKLGDAGNEELGSINVTATTNGTFITTRHNTTFAKGSAVETFTWRKNGGSLQLYGYNIQSNALVVNRSEVVGVSLTKARWDTNWQSLADFALFIMVRKRCHAGLGL